MSQPHTPGDPPASISAAELRRRLLASTPPPIASSVSTPAEMDANLEAAAVATSPVASQENLFSKLRLPPPASTQQTVANEPVATPYGGAGVAKRTPIVGMRGLDANAFAQQVSVEKATGSGVVGIPAARQSSQAPSEQQPRKTGSGAIRSETPRPERDESADIRRYRSENKELRKLLEEMKHLLQEASDNESRFAAKEAENQAVLAEKQRQIDDLTTHIQSIEEQIANSGGTVQSVTQTSSPPKTRSELEDWADELEKESSKLNQERKRMNEERQQLREDEAGLEKQMRDMEVAMARERALMARQETELKRLSAEIQHELEMMQRGDASLRDQMQKFQRRAQDVMQGKVNQNVTASSTNLNPRRS